jgi:hypothetical protein
MSNSRTLSVSEPLAQRAIVVGASISGMLAARVLIPFEDLMRPEVRAKVAAALAATA